MTSWLLDIFILKERKTFPIFFLFFSFFIPVFLGYGSGMVYDKDLMNEHHGDPNYASQRTRDRMKSSYIVSIDIGTSGIGIAITFPKSDPASPDCLLTLEKDENIASGVVTSKPPSDVAFLRGGDFNIKTAIVGREAVRVAKKNPENYCHFINYKRDVCGIDGNPVVKPISLATNGEYCETVNLFSAAIYKCKKVAIKTIKKHQKSMKQHGLNIENKTSNNKTNYGNVKGIFKDVYFILLHPAFKNSETYRDFLRQAAVRAGLVKNIYDEHLWFLSEPVSAGLYLIAGRRIHFPSGTDNRILIVDIGGGTTDLAVLKVRQLEYNVIECVEHESLAYGSSNINIILMETFAHLLTKGRYGHKIFDTVPGLTARMNEIAEDMKFRAQIYVSNENVGMSFDISEFGEVLCKKYDLSKETLDESIKYANEIDHVRNFNSTYKSEQGAWFLREKNGEMELFMSQDYVLFVIEHVANTVAFNIKEYTRAHKIIVPVVVMVGGFSASTIMHQAIRNCIRRTSILEYNEKANVAVTLGGCCFPCLGDNPEGK